VNEKQRLPITRGLEIRGEQNGDEGLGNKTIRQYAGSAAGKRLDGHRSGEHSGCGHGS
jgi:hypothetical protein